MPNAEDVVGQEEPVRFIEEQVDDVCDVIRDNHLVHCDFDLRVLRGVDDSIAGVSINDGFCAQANENDSAEGGGHCNRV